jgi:hypothetical protein
MTKTVVFPREVFDKVKELLESEKEISEFTVSDEGASESTRATAKVWLDIATQALQCMEEATDTE